MSEKGHGSNTQSTLEGSDKATVNQTNDGTVSKGNIRQMRWSTYGLPWAHGYYLELYWNKSLENYRERQKKGPSQMRSLHNRSYCKYSKRQQQILASSHAGIICLRTSTQNTWARVPLWRSAGWRSPSSPRQHWSRGSKGTGTIHSCSRCSAGIGWWSCTSRCCACLKIWANVLSDKSTRTRSKLAADLKSFIFLFFYLYFLNCYTNLNAFTAIHAWTPCARQ